MLKMKSISLIIVLSLLLAVVGMATDVPTLPRITKYAKTELERAYNWNILKTADKGSLLLSTGQSYLATYTITVSALPADSKWKVSGRIEVHNWLSSPSEANNPVVQVNTVTDTISGFGSVPVTCREDWPLPAQIPSGWSYACTYAASLPDGSARTNTGSANVNLPGAPAFDVSVTVPFDFTTATVTELDECITVTDTYAGNLGQVCYGQAPKTFTYSRLIGPYDVCGEYLVTNTASFVTNDSKKVGSSTWNIKVSVPCVGGCTLTPGYWKTHSSYGPAPYDSTWALKGENTPFFLSGKSWYQVLWTAPKGNAYYILAHAYIAAQMNLLNGASATPDVTAALAWATNFFTTYAPSATLSKELRGQVTSYAGLLDKYNNGLVGPGHCSE